MCPNVRGGYVHFDSAHGLADFTAEHWWLQAALLSTPTAKSLALKNNPSHLQSPRKYFSKQSLTPSKSNHVSPHSAKGSKEVVGRRF